MFKIKLIDNNLIPKDDRCEGCKKNEKNSPHTCPFAEEIGGDNETLCTCCDYCTVGCAEDI